MSLEPTAMNLEQDDQAKQVVSLYAPLSTLSIQKGLYSRENGPGAEYTKALSSLVMAKCFESGLNFMQFMVRLVRSLWSTDLDIRDIRTISPSSLAANKLKWKFYEKSMNWSIIMYLTPFGDKSTPEKLNLDSTGSVSDLWFLRSKSVILFPTGEMTVFPSGVKIKSPPL